MALSKLTITAETAKGKFNKEIKVLFNPNTISIAKSAQWPQNPKPGGDTPNTGFSHGHPVKLNLDLFFDTYGEADKAKQDVRNYTRNLFHLTTVQKNGNLDRPPLCKLKWGSFNFSEDYLCSWMLVSLTQRFTLFLSNGTPARATLTCAFEQYRPPAQDSKITDQQSPDVAKRRTVQIGETLSSIAAEEYDDPKHWRFIAKENGVVNPRVLKPGQILSIPVLPGSA